MSSMVRDVPPDELREDALRKLETAGDDVLVWLDVERTLEAASRKEAFMSDDKVKANRHDARCNKFASAYAEIQSLRERMAAFQLVLANRIIIALGEAERPPWRATHRHYKGALYRVTGTRMDANGDELVEGVEYDDATGKRFFLRRERWESRTSTGRLRYQPLLEGE